MKPPANRQLCLEIQVDSASKDFSRVAAVITVYFTLFIHLYLQDGMHHF